MERGRTGTKGESMSSYHMTPFLTLCRKAKHSCETLDSVSDFEPDFMDVLNYIHANPTDKMEFVRIFIEMLDNKELGPWELISFCLHDQRWPEVKDAALNCLNISSDHRIKSVMADIVAACCDDWVGAKMYAYFQCD